MLTINLDCAGRLYTFDKEKNLSIGMTGKASNSAFVILDLGQLPWSVFSCVGSPVSDRVEMPT